MVNTCTSLLSVVFMVINLFFRRTSQEKMVSHLLWIYLFSLAVRGRVHRASDRTPCASGNPHRTNSCSNRNTTASGGVHRISSCYDRSTCASSGIHRNYSAVVAALAPAEKYIAVASACVSAPTCSGAKKRQKEQSQQQGNLSKRNKQKQTQPQGIR